ncbi:hypothetical protein GCM10008905_22290 [Clostridium malenominatum]|uniref:Phage protein n=1 Tax=Clostridium malenominatum TaxID=1539 RepID=A0ABP3U7E6_9CLOT
MIFLFLLLACSSLCFFYYLDNKISLQKREIVLLNKQIRELKNKLKKQNELKEEI